MQWRPHSVAAPVVASTRARDAVRCRARSLGAAPNGRGVAPPPSRYGTDGCTKPCGIRGEPAAVDEMVEMREVRAVADLRHGDAHHGRELDDLGGGPRSTSTRRSPVRSRRGATCGTSRVPCARRRASRRDRSSRRSRATAVRSWSAARPSRRRSDARSATATTARGRNGSPASWNHVTGYSGWLYISASSAATSTRSPTPLTRRGAAPPTHRWPPYVPAAHSPGRPPHSSGRGCRACRVARGRRTTPGA